MARAAGPQWLLRRFRRASAPPGRPAHALGVPAGAGDLADELQPLLMALDEVERDGASIRERAAADADAHASHAIEDAERLASLDKLRLSYDPNGPLGRGFARVEKADGHLATSAAALSSGEQVQLVFADGKRGAVIDGARPSAPPAARPQAAPPQQGDLF